MPDVELSGPLFDGRANAAVQAFLSDAALTVAEEGEELVRQRLTLSIRNRTGNYESSIRTVPADAMATVDDSGVVYGPWLEGTGSRNRTTRFKGYRSFRIATQLLAGRAGAIASRVLPRYIDRMGG